jgi:hypothetical protein
VATKKKPTAAAAPPKRPPAKAASVATFMSELDHPLKAEIEALRALVLGAHEGITEHIKWNAPSFCYGGDDRVTFRLQPTSLQLIFHRGAKVKSVEGFAFADPSGLLKLITPDRGVVTFASMADITRQQAALTTLVARWIDATVDDT